MTTNATPLEWGTCYYCRTAARVREIYIRGTLPHDACERCADEMERRTGRTLGPMEETPNA